VKVPVAPFRNPEESAAFGFVTGSARFSRSSALTLAPCKTKIPAVTFKGCTNGTFSVEH
jgi:hypothetical protein